MSGRAQSDGCSRLVGAPISQRVLRRALLRVVLLILCAGGGVLIVAGSSPDGPGERAVCESEAKDRVLEFLRAEGDLRSQESLLAQIGESSIEEHPNMGALYVFRGELGEFWVSRQRGNVVTYAAPKRLSVPEAEDYVKAFLRRHVADFDQRHFVRVDTKLTEPLWEEEWREEPREPDEAAIFENWATIQVNLETRRVHFFGCSDLRHVRTTPPGIDEATARQTILARYPEGELLELKLMEHTTDGGQTWVTIWHAVVRPDEDPESPCHLHSIDADNGDVVPQ